MKNPTILDGAPDGDPGKPFNPAQHAAMSIAINPGEDPTASSGTSPDPSSDTDGSRSSSSSSGSSGSRDGKEAIVPHDPY